MIHNKEPNFKFKNKHYNIIAFEEWKEKENNYKFLKKFGDETYKIWIFNINDKAICVYNVGNCSLDQYSAVVKDNYIHIVTDFDYFKINLDTFECEVNIELDSAPFDEIYEFQNGFVLIGETDIYYIENDKIIWEYNSFNYIEYAIPLKDDTIEVKEGEPSYKKFLLSKNGAIVD